MKRQSLPIYLLISNLVLCLFLFAGPMTRDVAATPATLFISDDSSPGAPVPEPGTMFLFGIGLLGMAGLARRKR